MQRSIFSAPAALAPCAMRRILMLALALAAFPAYAQETLRDAVERAWARQPAALAQPARAEQFGASRDAAEAPFPRPPSFSIGNRNDRFNRNLGANEWEAEIGLPLWLPGEQERLRAIASAERDQYDTGLTAAKLKIANEVREAYWQLRLAENQLVLARRNGEEAVALAADVERRVKAGDLARVDLNQALAAERSARGALTEAETRLFRARQRFAVLTGVDRFPAQEESMTRGPFNLDDHPALALLQRAVATAQAKLRQAAQSLRNNPEIELGMRRERSAFDEPYANSLQMRLRLPFATEARNKPRIAAANAEMIEAQAVYGVERARIAAEIEAARREMEQARALMALGEARYALAADTQRLIAVAFALGEVDLFTRLRAENERFGAERDFTRSRLEAARAISRLNQALGVLP